MAEKRSKKELLRAFKAEREVGGVYAIKNRETGRALIQTTTTISKAPAWYCTRPNICRWKNCGYGTPRPAPPDLRDAPGQSLTARCQAFSLSAFFG